MELLDKEEDLFLLDDEEERENFSFNKQTDVDIISESESDPEEEGDETISQHFDEEEINHIQTSSVDAEIEIISEVEDLNIGEKEI